ncbi:MAG: energy transducer TonB [Candidatus Sulfotelmatobacter sp.]|jgi:protein TonB
MFNGTAFDKTLFADTLDPSWTERARRGWTTLTSFGLQALIVGVLLVLPLLRPTGLPSFHQLSTPISLGQPLPEGPVMQAHSGSNSAPDNPAEFIFRRPSALPINMHPASDDGPPGVQTAGPGLNVPGGIGSGDPHGLPGLFESGTRPVLPTPPPVMVTHPLRRSHISEGDLIHKVQPAYPALARSSRIQGVVVLEAMISKQGTIENLRLLAGHPMLAPAAIDAVRQWRYRPYILNGEPVEVETQITVNFALGGN